MKKIIYADNAATTALRPIALAAMKPYLINEFGNPSQPYSFARSCKLALIRARETIASCINADPDEIFFTSGGTESDNWAIKGTAFLNYERKAVITSAIEHHAILNSCKFIEKQCYPVAYLPALSDGTISIDALKSIITSNTYLVSIMLANNEIGTIEPIKELASIAHGNGAIFHTDAVQAIGHIHVDVKDLGIDLLSASAHKFGGPRGVGFLYIKNGTRIAPLLDGGSQEQGFRAGTENVAGIVGMAAALKESCESVKNSEKLYGYERRLLHRLQESGIRLSVDFIWNGNHETGKHLPGLMSLSFLGKDGEMLLHRLDLKGIMVATGAACDSRSTQVSHVISSIGVPSSFAVGTIRISLSQNSSIEDVDAIAKAIVDIMKG
mgnify:FL=1